MTENQYIFYRKLKAFGNRLAFHLCRIFPIENNLVSVCTFEGKGGFGCNPKYVVQKLHEQDPDVKFVWLVNPDVIAEKQFPDYIQKVPNSLWSRAYWLTRSKIWIDNYRKPYGTCKRKGQYYINVNHYTLAIKCTGLNRGAGFSKMAYLVSKNDSDMMDALVIDSKWCELSSPRSLVFDGPLLKTGAPRCDVLYGDRTRWKEKIRERHHLPAEAKIVMFAPTFREGAKNGVRSVYSEEFTIDFERLLSDLKQRFGGDWYICLRVHPQLANTFQNNFATYSENIRQHIFDESKADDMYEILAGMDAYITDYSSACFEAGFAGIPVFIYADDLQQYVHDRGNLMWNVQTDPLDHLTNNQEMTPGLHLVFSYSIATDMDGLSANILSFDEQKFEDREKAFEEENELLFDGKASERLAGIILKKMRG